MDPLPKPKLQVEIRSAYPEFFRKWDGQGFLALENDDLSLSLADNQAVADLFADRGVRLVVLSACETGVNALAPGDDLIGLARGFFAAGTPALVVSLWNIDDAATAQLMEHFYTRLHAGDGIAAALRAAQRLGRLLGQPDAPFEHNMFESDSFRLYILSLPGDLCLFLAAPLDAPLGAVRHNLRRTGRELAGIPLT